IRPTPASARHPSMRPRRSPPHSRLRSDFCTLSDGCRGFVRNCADLRGCAAERGTDAAQTMADVAVDARLTSWERSHTLINQSVGALPSAAADDPKHDLHTQRTTAQRSDL